MKKITIYILISAYLFEGAGGFNIAAYKTYARRNALRPLSAQLSLNKPTIIDTETPVTKMSSSGLSANALKASLSYLRDILDIYPGNDFSVASRLMLISPKQLQARVKAVDDITVTGYNKRFNFNICPALLAQDDKAYQRWVSRLKAISKKDGLKGLRAGLRRDIKKITGKTVTGELLSEYYKELQDPVFDFVKIQDELAKAEQRHNTVLSTGLAQEEKEAGENDSRIKNLKSFLEKDLNNPSPAERIKAYKKRRLNRPIRLSMNKNGYANLFNYNKSQQIRLFLGSGRWDPVNGNILAESPDNIALHDFTRYSDGTARDVWIRVLLLKNGRLGLLMYLREDGKPVKFLVWDEGRKRFKYVFLPADIAISENAVGTKNMMRSSMEGKVKVRGEFTIPAEPIDYGEGKGRAVLLDSPAMIIVDDVIKGPAFLRSVRTAKGNERIKLCTKEDEAGESCLAECYCYAMGGKIRGRNLIYEASSRFSEWDIKGPIPDPVLHIMGNKYSYIYLQKTEPGKNVTAIKLGERSLLKKGDAVWIDFTPHKIDNKICKGARVFKLDKDLIPVSLVCHVWYDDKTAKFRNAKGSVPHMLKPSERLESIWKIFWFGWNGKIAGFDMGSLSPQHMDELILDILRKKPMTINEIAGLLGEGDSLKYIESSLNRLLSKRAVVHIGFGRYAYLDEEFTADKTGTLSINGHHIFNNSNVMAGDKIRPATEDGWPIMLYHVMGERVRIENPVPAIVQRDEHGAIVRCLSRDIDLKDLDGKYYFENVPLKAGGYYKKIGGSYRLYLKSGIETGSGPFTATIFFDGRRMKEIHYYKGYTSGNYSIDTRGGRYKIKLNSNIRPRAVLKNLPEEGVILPEDSKTQRWDNPAQLTEAELLKFIWSHLEKGPKRFNELIELISDRRYPYLDLEKILKKAKGPGKDERIVVFPDGRYAAAVKRTLNSKKTFNFRIKYYTGHRWGSQGTVVWVAYRDDFPIAVTGSGCDFSQWENADFVIHFKDKDGNIFYSQMDANKFLTIDKPIVVIDNIPMRNKCNKLITVNGVKMRIDNKLNGAAVGKVSSVVLKKTKQGTYNILRVDYWNGYSHRYIIDASGDGEVSIDIDPKEGTPSHSVTNIKGECTGITPIAYRTNCEGADIIDKRGWQNTRRRMAREAGARIDEHLTLARYHERRNEREDAFRQYHMALAQDILTDSKYIRKKLLNISLAACLENAYKNLEEGRYAKAAQLFEQAEGLITNGNNRYNQAFAKAKVLSAFHEGMRLYENGNYELATKMLNQALACREALGGNFISEKDIEAINEKLRKAEALSNYLKARALFLGGRNYREAIRLLKRANPKENGLRRYRLSLTVDMVTQHMKDRLKVAGETTREAIDDAIDNARMILSDLDKDSVLPGREAIKKAISDLTNNNARRVLNLSSGAKRSVAELLAANLKEVLSGYDAIEKEAKTDAGNVSSIPRIGDEAEEGTFYEDGVAAGGAWNWQGRATSKIVISGMLLSEIQKQLPGFKKMDKETFATECNSLLKGNFDRPILAILDNMIINGRYILALTYILKIADEPTFTDSSPASKKNLQRLKENMHIAIEGVKREGSAVAGEEPGSGSMGISMHKAIMAAA